ncbi:hypothetical protein PoB_006814000 [Plakobranchus ocellatus]|uniref:Uncharacterized protein n=1 Tax=Plakobranchus ocellatus TaxID=259542 RepID=A0AAV4DC20_9GAST|nr:hypothetical protein PoB_006814000 [Plakobranchus ocellatus]
MHELPGQPWRSILSTIERLPLPLPAPLEAMAFCRTSLALPIHNKAISAFRAFRQVRTQTCDWRVPEDLKTGSLSTANTGDRYTFTHRHTDLN